MLWTLTWALEISLDVQWAHAIAPNARILLVEAQSNSLTDLFAAINYATNRPDVVAVSMSWGTSEFLGQNTYDSYLNSSNGKVFFAATGDNGAGVIYPATSPNVIAVGGTHLNFNPDGTVASETGWTGSGGGVSIYENEPQYQLTYNISGANGKRAIPDVSYNSDPASGYSVYDTTTYQGQIGWFTVGGTSAASPQWAAIHSLGLSASNNNFYQDAKSSNPASFFRDVTSGSNGNFSAAIGHDFVTGLGSPLTWNYTLGGGLEYSISASPNVLTLTNGASATSNIPLNHSTVLPEQYRFLQQPPLGWTATFNPHTPILEVGETKSSILTLTLPQTVKAGTYNATIISTYNSLIHNVSLTLNVQTVPSPPNNFSTTRNLGEISLNWFAPLTMADFQ